MKTSSAKRSKKKSSLSGLKSTSSKAATTKSKKGADEVLVKGEFAIAIDALEDAKVQIKKWEGIAAVSRDTVGDKANKEMITQIIEDGNHDSLKFITKKGGKLTYIMQDRFCKIQYADEEELEEYYEGLTALVGAKNIDKFVDEATSFSINMKLLDNPKIMKELEKFAKKIATTYEEDLLVYKEQAFIKKGALDLIKGVTKKSRKAEQIVGMIQPVVQIR